MSGRENKEAVSEGGREDDREFKNSEDVKDPWLWMRPSDENREGWAAFFAIADAALAEDWRERISMTNPYNSSEDERKAFYKLVLRIEWLSRGVRTAVRKELGLGRVHARTAMAIEIRIRALEAHMQLNGEKPPRGSIHDAAVAEIAREHGIEPETLIQRIKRDKRRRRKKGK